LRSFSHSQEICVYFVTDAASALPGADDWPAAWAAQQEWKARKKAHDDAKAAVRFRRAQELWKPNMEYTLWPTINGAARVGSGEEGGHNDANTAARL